MRLQSIIAANALRASLERNGVTNEKSITRPKSVALGQGQSIQAPSWLKSVAAATGKNPAAREIGSTLLLLDVSGSMWGAPLAEAISGAKRFNMEAIQTGIHVGLVTFCEDAVLRAKPTVSGIEKSLDQVTCGGGTKLTEAITVATKVLTDCRGRRTIVVATDGQASDQADALVAAKRAKDLGIIVVAIGTTDADSTFLSELAGNSECITIVNRGQLGIGIESASRLLLR